VTRAKAVQLVLLVAVVACAESFLPASVVTDLRAVAARTDVGGAPGRANPDPEDEIQVSWLVIDQGRLPELQWSFVACIPAATLFGSPICTNRIMPCEGCEETPPGNPLATPEVRFRVPTEAELMAASATSVVVQGAICANGPPAEDSIARFILGETDDINPCEDPNNQGRFVSAEIPIEANPADPNLNPQILNLTWNGRPWPPPYDQGVPRAEPSTGCLSLLQMLPQEVQDQHPIAGSPPSTINLSVTSESLQTFTVDGIEETEEIQVSWLSDGGEFDTTFSFISDPASQVLTAWRPLPVDISDGEGLLVRLNFVIRDGRGGVDFVERGLCVGP
jgi:hypothetical protein